MLNPSMTRPNVSPRSRRVVQRAADIRRATGSDIRRIREDAGVSLLALARASGVSVGHLWAIEAGTTDASTEALVAIGESVGADLSVRLYPTTGPRIRDHLQARIGETLLQAPAPAMAPLARGRGLPTGTRRDRPGPP